VQMTTECESNKTKDIKSYVISRKRIGHCDDNDKKILLKLRSIGKIPDIYFTPSPKYHR
jgi:hypothetical protein